MVSPFFTNESGPANEIGIRVRNVEFGTPAECPCQFEIREPNQNRPSGSMLNTRMSQSNQFGIAKVTSLWTTAAYFLYFESPNEKLAHLQSELGTTMRVWRPHRWTRTSQTDEHFVSKDERNL